MSVVYLFARDAPLTRDERIFLSGLHCFFVAPPDVSAYPLDGLAALKDRAALLGLGDEGLFDEVTVAQGLVDKRFGQIVPHAFASSGLAFQPSAQCREVMAREHQSRNGEGAKKKVTPGVDRVRTGN